MSARNSIYVIPIGTGTEALAAIKIVACFDESGVAGDRYLFNMKVSSRRVG